ncbi:MAG: RNA polymerase sigma factor [Ruminococcaceae bacterium]|nr:RNA polymerase sigma factor [Oscillospiraceae bacterium]
MDKSNELYRRFLQGDNDALGALVNIYNERLILFLYGFVKDSACAEDLAADTFLYLLVKKPSFRQESAFKTWLFRIAQNKAIDFLRKQKRYPEISLDNIKTDLPSSDLPELRLLQEERNRKLYIALQKLPGQYRTVLQLLYFEEMTYKQAGAVLRMSEKQIRNLSYNARNSLREACKKEGIENAFE